MVEILSASYVQVMITQLNGFYGFFNDCFQFTHFPCDDWENVYTLS